jgi:hypothetical protein
VPEGGLIRNPGEGCHLILAGDRESAERETTPASDQPDSVSQTRVQEPESDRETLLESISGQIPEDLDYITGEDRNTSYRMLQVEIAPTPERFYNVTGLFVLPSLYQHERTAPKSR